LQGVILAAGSGRRLAPLTDTLPKCLIPIENKPILSYQIEALRKGGVREICVVAGSHKEKVSEFLKTEREVSLIENPEYQTTNVLTSFWYALNSLKEKDLLITAGDVIFDETVTKGLVQSAGEELTLCVARRRCGEEEVKVVMEGDRILKLGKQLDPEGAYGEFLGIFRIRSKALPSIQAIVNEMMTSRQIQNYLFDVINRFIQEKRGDVKAFDIRDAFCEDIDTQEDIERVSRKMSQGTGPVGIRE